MTETKKLEDLYTDSSLLDEEEIASTIFPLIAIQKNTKKIFIKSEESTHQQKIVAYVLAKKLLASNGEIESDRIFASEVLKDLGLKRGTVDGELGKLRKKRILITDKKTEGYEIPVYKIKEALEILTKNK